MLTLGRWSAVDLIDDEGSVFGLVNVVDLLVVVVIAAFAVGGVALVAGDIGGLERTNLTVTIESVERPFISTALADAGHCDRGATVEHVLVTDRFVPENESVQHERLRVRAGLDAVRDDGGWRFHGQDVYVGSELDLDFCSVRLSGTVVEIEEGSP